ncbi:hypothetical protein HK101_002525 [Irineochytrium annulatum]|nr:hypothetical protein HK101_002525 [Irineochytrium annulatum]
MTVPDQLTCSVYLGVPFAQPPVGERRWRSPIDIVDGSLTPEKLQPHRRTITVSASTPDEHSQEVVKGDAVFRPNPCALDPYKAGSYLAPATDALHERRYGPQPGNSEDCLYLNIWVPDNHVADAKLPVMVVVPGGAFTSCNTSNPIFDPLLLALHEDMIVVTIAYRVGFLGFLGSDDDAEHRPNLGLEDITSALRWVKRHIGALGGDPARITAWGESAGAICLHYLMISDDVEEGLFDRVILQSGVLEGTLPRTRDSAAMVKKELWERLGLKGTGLEAGRGVPAEDVVEANRAMPKFRPRSQAVEGGAGCTGMVGPILDGVVVPKDFVERLNKGWAAVRNGKGGVLIGVNDNEGTLFANDLRLDTDVEKHIARFPEAMGKKIKQLYGPIPPGQGGYFMASRYIGDMSFNLPITRTIHHLATTAPAGAAHLHAYHYSLRTCPELSTVDYIFGAPTRFIGVAHTIEMPHVFHSLLSTEWSRSPAAANVAALHEELRISREVVGKRWGAFVRGGEPWSGVGVVKERGEGTFMVFKRDAEGKGSAVEMAEEESEGGWRSGEKIAFLDAWGYRFYYGDEVAEKVTKGLA